MPFGGTSVEVDAAQWLTANPNMNFTAWKEKATQKLSHIKSLNKQETHNYRLMEKYGLKWKQKAHKAHARNWKYKLLTPQIQDINVLIMLEVVIHLCQ